MLNNAVGHSEWFDWFIKSFDPSGLLEQLLRKSTQFESVMQEMLKTSRITPIYEILGVKLV